MFEKFMIIELLYYIFEFFRWLNILLDLLVFLDRKIMKSVIKCNKYYCDGIYILK